MNQDLRTIVDFYGNYHYLSDEVYVLRKTIPPYSLLAPNDYNAGNFVRMISGVEGSKIPGYHPVPKYSTVCLTGVKIAQHVGVLTSDLILVPESELYYIRTIHSATGKKYKNNRPFTIFEADELIRYYYKNYGYQNYTFYKVPFFHKEENENE